MHFSAPPPTLRAAPASLFPSLWSHHDSELSHHLTLNRSHPQRPATPWDTVLAFRGGCPPKDQHHPLSPPSSTPALGPLGLVMRNQAQREEVNPSWLLSVSMRLFGQRPLKVDLAGWACLISDTQHRFFHSRAILAKGLLYYLDKKFKAALGLLPEARLEGVGRPGEKATP